LWYGTVREIFVNKALFKGIYIVLIFATALY